MCGILGIGNLSGRGAPLARESLAPALDCLAHRGPDDQGFFLGPGVALGFRRLSIVDLRGGHQPLPNEDDTVWVVHNGEIYNHLDLRLELEGAGHRFRTRSDAEALVHGYEAWGLEGLLERLRGMFAFLVWDTKMRRLSAARDRLGLKPLYFAEHQGRLFLASEIRPLLIASGMDRRINASALGLYLRLGYTPAPDTLFSGISKLPAAHTLCLENGRYVTRCYWRLSYAPRRLPAEEQIVEEFRCRVEDSVSRHLMGDVPVGALLSGGVDSGTIVTHMHHSLPNGFPAITVGFPAAGYDEKPRAMACAAELGLDHTVFDFTGDLMDDYPQMLAAMEEPLARNTFAALYHLFRVCRAQGLKVVLTGEGADELLGGYFWHWQDSGSPGWWKSRPGLLRAASSGRHRFLETALEGARRLEEGLRTNPGRLVRRYADCIAISPPSPAAGLLTPDLRGEPAAHPGEEMPSSWGDWVAEVDHPDPFQQLLWLQARTRLPDYVNLMVDRMSMAHSVEARPPFLDHTLWEYCAPLPRRFKVRGYYPNQVEKFLLRQSGLGRVPETVRTAAKAPLRVPYPQWLAQPRLPAWAEEALTPAAIRGLGIFEPTAIAALRRGTLTDPNGRSTLLMAVLALQVWAKIFDCRL